MANLVVLDNGFVVVSGVARMSRGVAMHAIAVGGIKKINNKNKLDIIISTLITKNKVSQPKL